MEDGYRQVSPDQIVQKMGLDQMNSMSEMFSSGSSYQAFTEMLDNEQLMKEQYEILAGKLPTNYNEVILVVNKDNYISDYTLYSIGLLDSNEFVDKYKRLMKGEKVEELEELTYTYDELLNVSFKVLLNTDYYQKENGIWVDHSDDEAYMKEKLDQALELKVVGIIRPKEETITSNSFGGVEYTKELTEYVVNQINHSDIAKEQKEKENINVFTNQEFSEEEFNMNQLSAQEKAYLATLSQEELAQLLKNYQENASATYESNLEKLGIVDLEHPSMMQIYAKDFDSKEALSDFIEKYNQQADDTDKISYTDVVELMMSGVSNIIDIISYVLISFVSISLVVSSIMIGIITYISVLERTKEIGILRSIGASKKDISRVFNAETLIVGLTAGVLGILITVLLNIPINMVIHSLTGIGTIAKLPFTGGVILVFISIFLTVIAGLIPSRIASKKDPVEALRTE